MTQRGEKGVIGGQAGSTERVRGGFVGRHPFSKTGGASKGFLLGVFTLRFSSGKH